MTVTITGSSGIETAQTGDSDITLDAGTGSEAGTQASTINMKLNGTLKGDISVDEARSGNPLELNTTSTGNVVLAMGGGNVGIGAAAPGEKLTVVGDMSVTGGNVGIGTTSPYAINGENLEIYDSGGVIARLNLHTSTGKHWAIGSVASDSSLQFYDVDSATEAARFDSSQNFLVGTTDNTVYNNSGSGTGINLQNFGNIAVARDGADCMALNRLNSDGTILLFNKDGTEVGTIGTYFGGTYIGSPVGSDAYLFFYSNLIRPAASNGTNRDNVIDLGESSSRFDDIYATNGTIQTSDANEKQDVAELDEAEKRVATAAKGLIRKFRWIASVEEKGDDARIHIGVIAQDLQAAFEAEGLDPGRYGMFISSTWWEADEVVPAIEEVIDEEGNVITEAKPEYTRTNTYQTAEEAPEGAVERTRLGVRYNQLLAFIISAM